MMRPEPAAFESPRLAATRAEAGADFEIDSLAAEFAVAALAATGIARTEAAAYASITLDNRIQIPFHAL